MQRLARILLTASLLLVASCGSYSTLPHASWLRSASSPLMLEKNGPNPFRRWPVSGGPMYITDKGRSVYVAGDGIIWRISPFAVVSTYISPFSTEFFRGITEGSDGNIWSCDSSNDSMDRLTPSGVWTAFNDAQAADCSGGLVGGADGNLWYTLNNPDAVQRISTSGTNVVTYPLSAANGGQLIRDQSGLMWFTLGDAVASIDTNGTITEYATTGTVRSITPGAAGGALFTESNSNPTCWVESISDQGVQAQVGPTTGCGISAIAQLPDGSILVGQQTGTGRTEQNNLLKYTTATNAWQTISIPSVGYGEPDQMVAGVDGNLYFTQGADAIASYQELLMSASPTSLSFAGIDQQKTLTIEESNYSGAWTAISGKPSVATVSQAGPNTFTVTSVASGSCAIEIFDSYRNELEISVNVP